MSNNVCPNKLMKKTTFFLLSKFEFIYGRKLSLLDILPDIYLLCFADRQGPNIYL